MTIEETFKLIINRPVLHESLPAEDKKEIIEKLIADPALLLKLTDEKLVTRAYRLKTLTDYWLPEYKDLILDKILSNKELFLEFFYTESTLSIMADYFPNHSSKFIEKIMNDATLFKKILPNRNEISHFVADFPTYKDKLFKIILNNEIFFKEIMPNETELNLMKKSFQDYQYQFDVNFILLEESEKSDEPLVSAFKIILEGSFHHIKALNEKLLTNSPPKVNNKENFLEKIKKVFRDFEAKEPELLSGECGQQWREEIKKFISYFELNLVKQLVGFFKRQPEAELENIKKQVPEDIRGMLETIDIGGNITTPHP